ncbi:MAG TPA: hypothetical protein VG224_18385 [Reyranella sp.]|jgi:hypothetical protein|nr:hypothetical protein [Reyranella sp.]
MASGDPAYVESFKQFMKEIDPILDLPKMETEFYGTSTRAVCILQGTLLENCLEVAIKSVLRPDLNSTLSKAIFGFDSPAGTFSAKINLAYALSLFGPATYRDFGLIRLIRNEFAHARKPATFADEPLAEVCRHLQLPDNPACRAPFGWWNTMPDEELREVLGDGKDHKTHPKVRFIMTCHWMATELLLFAQREKKAPLQASALP